MDDFVGEDGELFVDPGSCDSSPEHDGNRDGSPAAAHGGNRVSASKPRNRLAIKGGSGVRHGEGREYLGERYSALEDLEEGGGPRKRKRAADQPALGWGPEKHGLKRRKEVWRVGRHTGGDEEQGEWERKAMAAARFKAEEDKEYDAIDQLFQSGRNKTSHPRADAGLIVEELMAEFEVAFEDDALLNREFKAGTNKLKKLPLLVKVLSKKNLQKLFLQHGILALLKNWIQPLPDGSMPSAEILAAILRVLTNFPIDLEQPNIREQLKKSGLRKVIMFLSKSSHVSAINMKLASEVINKWSPQVEITRSDDDKKAHYRPPQMKRKGGQGCSRPEPSHLELVMRPKSKDPKQIRADAEQVTQYQQRHELRKQKSPSQLVMRPKSKADPEQSRSDAERVTQDQQQQELEKQLDILSAVRKNLFEPYED